MSDIAHIRIAEPIAIGTTGEKPKSLSDPAGLIDRPKRCEMAVLGGRCFWPMTICSSTQAITQSVEASTPYLVLRRQKSAPIIIGEREAKPAKA